MQALPEEDLEPLQSHLASCTECQAELEQTTAELDLLKQWDIPDPSPSLAERTFVQIRREAEVPVATSWWSRIDQWLQKVGAHRPSVFTGLATVCLTLVLGFHVVAPNWQRGRSSGGVTGCRNNLRVIQQALSQYHNTHQGRFPDNLQQLDSEILKQIPACPSAGHATYRYQVSVDHLSYSLCCQGLNHQESGLPADQPAVEEALK